jgi:amidophosphoribosyltransferase
MSELIKHECGIALIRLLKPLEYYQQKYGTALYALNKLYLLLEKQHNRGQDGAGVASIKFDTPPGERYISRYRSNTNTALKDIFAKIEHKYEELSKHKDKIDDTAWLKKNMAFLGELYLGHLRYGTFGANNLESCHPFLRQSNWKTKNLVVAGNFNLTNVDELFNQLVELGQHPKEKADTVTVMERIGHFLDVENENLFREYKKLGYDNEAITPLISKKLNLEKILREASKKWDGGYVMAGLLGHGDAFVLRDPNGIRPCYYYSNDEIIVVTSERPTIQTAFNVQFEDLKELGAGNALIIKKSGTFEEVSINKSVQKTSCSFERIYFSRGSDTEIYQERKKLGKNISNEVLKAIDFDVKNTVFSYIPNTAEAAFYGLIDGINEYLDTVKTKKLLNSATSLSTENISNILNIKPRVEKLILKDAKLRTFITNDTNRKDLVSHVYDICYGTIRANVDNIVLIDDSIVRGTTLKQSIIQILDRLSPKSIVIVSSAPQIRYPDCYGIDMAKMGDFIAFQAAIELLQESNNKHIITETYNKAILEIEKPTNEVENVVSKIFEPFSYEDISKKIASMLKTQNIKSEVKIVFQTIEGLHKSIPKHSGDWYFSGLYPTPGGKMVVNKSFINYYEGKDQRAY